MLFRPSREVGTNREQSIVYTSLKRLKEEKNGDACLRPLKEPVDAKNVEAVGRWAAQKCNLGPLASSLFGFVRSSNDSDTIYRLDPKLEYPIPNDCGGDYRLCVLPGSLDKLAELSVEALKQVFLAAKYDLMKNRIHLSCVHQNASNEICYRLCYLDLCRIVVDRTSSDDASKKTSDQTEIRGFLKNTKLHHEILKQYNEVKIKKGNILVDNLLTDRRMVKNIKKHVVEKLTSVTLCHMTDFMLDYLKIVSENCPEFLKNSYTVQKCEEESNMLAAQRIRCSSIEVGVDGLTLNARTVWTTHDSIWKISVDENANTVRIKANNQTSDLAITFFTATAVNSFVVELNMYHRVYKSFCTTLSNKKSDLFPSQEFQTTFKCWGPLCEFKDDNKTTFLREIQCAATLLSDHAGFNTIIFESAQKSQLPSNAAISQSILFNTVIAFVTVDQSKSEIHQFNRSAQDGEFVKTGGQTLGNFISSPDLKILFIPEDPLPSFRYLNQPLSKRFIQSDDPPVEGTFNVLVQGSYGEKHVIVKYVNRQKCRNPAALEHALKSFNESEIFLNDCDNKSAFIRHFYTKLASQSVYGSQGLVLEYFPENACVFLNRMCEDLSIRSLLNFCYHLVGALIFLRDRSIVHGEIMAKNILIQTNQNNHRAVLCEPSDKLNRRSSGGIPWIPSANSKPSLNNDVFGGGTAMWEILNFCHYPNDIVKDPYLFPMAKGLTTYFYATRRSYKRDAEFEPLSINVVGHKMQLLLSACWTRNPPAPKEILNQLDDAFSSLKLWNTNHPPIEITSGDMQVITSDNLAHFFVRIDDRLDHIIGRGHFGEILLAYDINNAQNVFALKQLSIEKAEKISLFTEIEIMMNCDHRNVLKCLGYIMDSVGLISFALMPYIKNRSLDHYARGHSEQLTHLQRVKICKEIAEGMLYLHSRPNPIIHFDLFARNILLDDDLTVKIADFGLCRYNLCYVESALIKAPPCWAPEWILEMQRRLSNATGNFNPSGDIYCFGVTVYQMETIVANSCKSSDESGYVTLAHRKLTSFKLQLDDEQSPFFQSLIDRCSIRDVSQRLTWSEIIGKCDEQFTLFV